MKLNPIFAMFSTARRAVLSGSGIRRFLSSCAGAGALLLAATTTSEVSAGTMTTKVTGTQGNVSGATITLTRGGISSVDQLPDDIGADFIGSTPYLNFANTTGNSFSSLWSGAPADHVGGVFTCGIQNFWQGIFRFYLKSDDGAKLFVDDVLVVNNDGNHPETELSGEIFLSGAENGGNEFHTVRVEYFEGEVNSTLQVAWEKPSQSRPFGRRNLGGNAFFSGAGSTANNYYAGDWSASMYRIQTSTISTTTDTSGNGYFNSISFNQPVTLTPSYPGGTFSPASRTVTGAGPHTFTLTSSPPSITDIANTSISEDGTGTVSFTINDYQTANTGLTLSVASSNAELLPVSAITLTGSGGSRGATLRPLPNMNGTSTVTITVTDGEGKTASDSFVVTVNAVNDAPIAGAATSIRLDGVNQHVALPAGQWFTNTFTVEAWVNLASHKTWARLFDFGNGPGAENVLVTLSENNSGKPRFDIYQGSAGTYQGIVSSLAIPTNTWTHVAVTRDAAGVGHIYINGVETASGAMWAPLNVSRNNNYIGRSNWTADGYTDGNIADFRIWNVARTQAEILAGRNRAVSSQTSGLILNYRFDFPLGTVVQDLASSVDNPWQQGAQNGTLVNGPTFPGHSNSLDPFLSVPVSEDTPTVIYLPGSDVESAVSYPSVTAISGTISQISGGHFLYTPPRGFTGTDTVSYSISDGSSSVASALKIQVNPLNNPPTAGPGSSISFNGSSQYLDAPDGFWFDSTFTVEGWVYVRSHANWARLLDFGNAAGVDNIVCALSYGTDGRPVFAIYDNTTPYQIVSSSSIPLNTWTHLSFSRDAGGIGRIHINGVETASGAMAVPRNLNRANNYIGRSNWGADAYANAKFADIRIWNYALSQTQLANNRHASVSDAAPGLMAYYRLNEDSGLTARDSATAIVGMGAGAQNATLVNGPLWHPVDGPTRSIALNGSSQNGQVLDSPSISITGNITMEAWIRPSTVGGTDYGIMNKYSPNDGGYGLTLVSAGRIYAVVLDKYGAAATVLGATVIDPNIWTHVAMRWDGLALQVFVNGVLDGTTITGRNPKDGPTALYVGSAWDGQSFRFNGRIGDVRLWNVARTPAEISAFRGGVAPNTPGLVLNYKFGEGSGTSVANSATAGGAQPLSLVGTPTWPGLEPILPTLQVVRFTEDTPVEITLPAYDSDGPSLTYNSISASSGSVTYIGGVNNNLFRYTPGTNHNAAATITYDVRDGTHVTAATIYLQGTPVEDPPYIAPIADRTIDEGGASTSVNLLLDDGDPELTQALEVTATSSNTTLMRNPVVNYTSPNLSGQISFKPRPGLSGTNTITVVVREPVSGLSHTTSFNVVVTPVDDLPNVGPATAAEFNGLNRMRIPQMGPKVPTEELTIEFWQFVNSAVDQTTLQLFPDDFSNRLILHTPWGNGDVIFDFGNAAAGGRLFYRPPVPIAGSWQHFAFVASRSGNYMKIFRNGIEEATKPGLSQLLPGTKDLRLGGFAGQLAEFRMWKIARTAEEIASTMHSSLRNDDTNLVAYYRFNQKPTLTLVDSASSVDQGGSQDGELVPDSADNDPIWQTTATQSGMTYQTSSAALAQLQVVKVPAGSTNTLYLPAWDAETASLQWQSVNVTTGTVTQISGGLFTYNAPTNYDGAATITYSVRDAANHVTSGSVNLRVIVAQNDAPTISAIPNVVSEEDTAIIEVPFTVDDDRDTSELVITPVALVNADLIQNVIVPPGGNFRALQIVPKPGEIGTVHLRVHIRDAGDKTAETEFDLRIEPKPAYSVVDLGILGAKAVSFGTAINDAGAVVGYMADTADRESNPVGFFFNGIENGGVIENNPPSLVGPSPLNSPFRIWALNNGYAMAGSGGANNSGSPTVAWYKSLEGGLVNLLSLSVGANAEARAINASGKVAGWSLNAGGKRRAFSYAQGDGAITDLGLAPAPYNVESEAFGINAAGDIVGAVYNAGGQKRAMIRKNSTMLPLFNMPNDTNSVATSINAFGQVVGSSSTFTAGDRALSFDGTDDYGYQTNLLLNPGGASLAAGNASHTVEAWIRADSVPTTRSWPLLLGNTGTGSHHWTATSTGGGRFEVGIYNGGSAFVPFTVGAWTHISGVYNASAATFVTYVNGRPYATNSTSGVNLQGIPLALGLKQAGETNFHGALDEVRVWNTARTATEIAANYTRRMEGDEAGLVAYFPFDEGTGTTTTSAANGHLVAGLTNGPTWTVRGGLPSPSMTLGEAALQFDGLSSRVVAPAVTLSNASFTVEFLARRTAVDKWDIAVGMGNNVNNRGLHIGFRPNNTFTLGFWADDLSTPVYTDTDLHHWACSYDAVTRLQKIYRDGVLVTQRIANANFTGSGPLIIGASFASDNLFKGTIDDVRIWNVVRTDAEIAANRYQRFPSTTPGLLANYTFDEGGGNITANRAPGGGSASLEGAISWSGRDNGSRRAFFQDLESGRFTSLGTVPDGGDSEAYGINDFGQIVGTAVKQPGQRAFLYSAGKFNDLNDLLPEVDQIDQWQLESARGINRSGAIVGTGTHRGVRRAFIALPATVIGRPVIRPQGAAERAPLVTILKKHLPDDTANNSYYWSESDLKLYAIRPVTAKIEWFTETGNGTDIESDSDRIVSVTVNVWPKDPIIHIAGAPVDIQPAITAASYSFMSLIYVTNTASVEPSSKVFTSATPGWTVAYYLKTDGQQANPVNQRPYFDVIRTVSWNDSHAALANQDWTIGQEVTDPDHREYGQKNGYVLFEKAAYDSVGADRAYDRGTRLGPILPVNTEKPGGNMNANPDPLLVVWYRTNRIGVAWASVPVKYSLNWPAADVAETIVIASQNGSGYLLPANYPAKTIYNQPDIALPGFNPNEEHAYMPENVLFAIRNDLNSINSYSEPHALLKYRDPSTARWKMKVFKVVAERAPYFFTYTGTAGKEIQPPLPLSLMPLCANSRLEPPNTEVGWEDYKGKVYARMAGPEGGNTNLVVRWYYPMQPGFYHPEAYSVGDCLAWLDRHPANELSGSNAGQGIVNTPIDVTYDIRWDDHHVLQVGQTLLTSTAGLPDVFNMADARIIFDSLSPGSPAGTNLLARFYDPISARTITTGVSIPASIKRQNIAGKEYFTDLPWFLKIRMSYDPMNNWLSFSGYLDENFGAGEPLLLPNVITERERDRIKKLADGDGAWAGLVERLFDLTRNPNQVDVNPVDRVPDKALRLGLITESVTNFNTINGQIKVVTQPPPYLVQTNVLRPGPFGAPTMVVEYVLYTPPPVTTWPAASFTPANFDDALRLDARLREMVQNDTFRPSGTLGSSFTIVRTVLPESLGSGPKALTAGLGGVLPAEPRPGNALSFTSADGLVTVGPLDGQLLSLSGTPFTIEFWARVNAPATEQYLVGQPGGPADLGRLRIGFRDGGKFAFDLGTTPVSVSIFNTAETYLETNWHHWACVFNPETKVQTIYYDGAVAETRTNLALNYNGLGALEIGRFGSMRFAGQLDEFRVWKTARSASQIRSQMNKRLLGVQSAQPLGAGSELGLEILYRCDEASGPLTNASFTTRNGYVGTLSTNGVSRVVSQAPAGIPPRYITVAENNNAALAGLPVALHVIRVDDGPFLGDLKVLPGDNVFDERLTMRHSSDFGGDPGPVTFQWYYKPIGADFDPTDLPVVNDPSSEYPSDTRGWTLYTNFRPTGGEGVNFITTGEGGESGIITLSDNAFICRYKGYAVNLNSAAMWSGWVGDPSGTPDQPRAALAEGWIKRVIRGLNPFDARTSDFHSAPSVTYASMLMLAGGRYEGPIAFNPAADAINGVGLIEAYTTVLNRARGLSIDAVPEGMDFNPANNALLLAAARISDLYMVLGNEAYADASDPTVGFGTSSQSYGSLASSIFTFQNQLDSLLEEELALLRGRDDSAAGVAARPVYNRLFWNFTLGDGEVAYQQSYNISDLNQDGFIDERDARMLYPQGHGDAWGHYLTAIRQYYTLLQHPNFTWVPRTEYVNIAGVMNEVDYLDERKFALAASAKAKSGAEIVNLTYRLNYVDDPSGQWQGYKDTKADRAWGVTEWARRAGMGAYFDWITGNAILPSTDPNPGHTGIRKIDRQTVRELHEIPLQFDEIQARLDEADAGLNPLGLAKGVVPFDIDPSLVSGAAGIAGKTHYEQIQDRALKAMNNATAVWDEVNKSTQALRATQDSVEEFTKHVIDQERDYKNRLIEIYGYPYAGDIGPGKTYPSGYDGPDLYHYMYTPVSELTGEKSANAPGFTAYFTQMNLGIVNSGDTVAAALGSRSQGFHFQSDFESGVTSQPYTNLVLQVNYPRTTSDYSFEAAPAWGSRRAPGEIQMALSDLLQSEAKLRGALKAEDARLADIDDKVDLLNARYALRAKELKLRNELTNKKISLVAGIIGATILQKYTASKATAALRMGEILADGLPRSVGLANDVSFANRTIIRSVALGTAEVFETVSGIAGAAALATEKIGLEAAQGVFDAYFQEANFGYEIEMQVDELQRAIREEAASRLEVIRLAEALRQSSGRYQAALAKGQRLVEERVAFRVRVAGQTTENRYQDMTFRIFRNDALQKYRASFDLAQRYVFLAATAYDYESNLLGTDTRGGRAFLTDIIRQRSLGHMLNGQPVVGRSGLADPLARMNSNFEVLKTQLGFNNPQVETDRFSLRNELFRLRNGSTAAWRSKLAESRVANLWDIPDFRRHCRSFAAESAGPQPGLVIRFPTSVIAGRNFFNWPLGGGDSAYDASRFATKIRSVGVWFTGYNGLGLSQTPRIYLVPSGADVLSSPTPNDFTTREWRVIDQALPVPFPIGANQLRSPGWIPINDSLGGNFADIRRFSSFRAYHDSGGFSAAEVTSDSRLIGRSVWNNEWVLIIPGQTFLANPNTGLDTFINSVGDIKLFFQTYSYSGN